MAGLPGLSGIIREIVNPSWLQLGLIIINNWPEYHIPIRHLTVIPLQIDRSRRKNIRNNSAAGRTIHWLVIDDLFTI